MHVCEVCGDAISPELAEKLIGCEKCGRMYAPCCNSEDPNLCVECVE